MPALSSDLRLSATRRSLALVVVGVATCAACGTADAPTSSLADGSAVDASVVDVTADGAATDTGSQPDAAALSDTGGPVLDGGEADVAVVDPCSPAGPGLTRTIQLPLGETLFFQGDDYLAFWGKDRPCAVQLVDKPSDALATVVLDGDRLTPDLPGTWLLHSGADKITVEVVANYWTSDTFQNFNYAPSSPIAAEPTQGGKTIVWVATPTSSAVQQVELSDAGAKNLKLVPTGAWPGAVVVWPGTDLLLVAQTARDSLGFLDRKTGTLVDAIRVGNEPANIIIDPTSGTPATVAYVALSGEDRVAKINLKTRTVVATVAVGRDPRAMALDADGHRLYVASLISSNSHPRGPKQVKDPKTGELYPVPEAAQRDVAAIDTETWQVVGWAREVGTILRGLFLQPASPKLAARLLVAATLANNTKLHVDADTRPHEHHLVALDPGKFSLAAPKKAVSAISVSVDLDKQPHGGGPAASPFSMALTPDGHYLVVSLSASQSLLFLDPVTLGERGRQATGHDPRGLLFAHGRVWTYAWLSDTLAGLPLPGAPTEVEVSGGGPGGGAGGGGAVKVKIWKMGALGSAKPVKLVVGADPTPADVRAGQRIFNDAGFSKYKEFSCNNCHIDGLSDGLTWDLLIDGPVNTIAFRNVGGTDPFLWGGQLPTLFDFSREVLKLVGAEASGQQMDHLTTYMMSVTAPPNPYTLPGGKLTAAATAGKALFGKQVDDGGGGCLGCHGGPLGTSGVTVKGKTPGELTDVPSLLGAYDTAPYGREGQWATLAEMVDFAVIFTGGDLDAAARKQLTAYVAQLPGDLLTLNSATPVNNAKYVWKGTPVEVVFSHVLAPAQVAKFSMTVGKVGAEKPLLGTWLVSGRYARFTPAQPLLGDKSYAIHVAAGLAGASGHTLPSPMTLHFQTGGTPAFDASGKWKLTLKNSVVGTFSVNIALIMAKGGKLTGVVLDSFDKGNIGADAVAGVVSGKVLALEPFYIDSTFGKFFIKDGVVSTLSDGDNDGFADAGEGSFDFKFGATVYKVGVTWKRTALPNSGP